MRQKVFQEDFLHWWQVRDTSRKVPLTQSAPILHLEFELGHDARSHNSHPVTMRLQGHKGSVEKVKHLNEKMERIWVHSWIRELLHQPLLAPSEFPVVLGSVALDLSDSLRPYEL